MSEELNLSINEIFYSLQGEGTQSGRPCTFVRLKGCPLRCSWCDTEYAFYEGTALKFSEVMARVRDYACPLVEVTGGEPLAQRNCVPFLQELVNAGYEVMIETSGAFDVSKIPHEVRIIMDIKAPGSNEEKRNLWTNLQFLKEHKDEIKIVIKDRADFDYALKACEEHKLYGRFELLLSAVSGVLAYDELADWILKSGKPFRFQHQLHRLIWPAKERGF